MSIVTVDPTTIDAAGNELHPLAAMIHKRSLGDIPPPTAPQGTAMPAPVAPDVQSTAPVNYTPVPAAMKPAPVQQMNNPSLTPTQQEIESNKPPVYGAPEYKDSRGRQILNAIAEGLVGATNPKAGMELADSLRDRKYNTAERNYESTAKHLGTSENIEKSNREEGIRQAATKGNLADKSTRTAQGQERLDIAAQKLKWDQDHPKGYNHSKVTVRLPDGTISMAMMDPRDPSRPPVEIGTGKALTDATVVDPSTISAEIRAKALGEYGNYYRAMQGQGYDDKSAALLAGNMVNEKWNVSVGGQLQRQAIEGEVSTIDNPINPKAGNVPAPSTPASSTPTPKGAIPAPAATPTQSTGNTKPVKPPNTPTNPSGPLSFNDKEFDLVNRYLSQLLGTSTGGRGQAWQLGNMKGSELLAKKLGLSPVELQSASLDMKSQAKPLQEAMLRGAAIDRINNNLSLYAPQVTSTVQKLADTGSPVLTAPLRDLGRLAFSSPELKQFQIALNAYRREYTYLTSGGAQSKAMLPASISKEMVKLMGDDISIREAAAIVQQVDRETKIEMQGMKKTQQDILDNIKNNVLGGGSKDKPEVPNKGLKILNIKRMDQ